MADKAKMTIEPGQQVLHEEQIEYWIEGLMECSFDKKQFLKETVGGPNPALISTMGERFLVTRREVIHGASMVRQFASVNKIPHSYKTAEILAEPFSKCKALYAIMLSMEFAMQNLVKYSQQKLEPLGEELADIADKIDKLQRFADIVRGKLNALRERAGDPDQPDVFMPKQEKPPVSYRPKKHVVTERKSMHKKASNFNLSLMIRKKPLQENDDE